MLVISNFLTFLILLCILHPSAVVRLVLPVQLSLLSFTAPRNIQEYTGDLPEGCSF